MNNVKFKIINAVTSLEEIDIIMLSAIILVQLYYLFLANYVGQNIIDSSNDVRRAM